MAKKRKTANTSRGITVSALNAEVKIMSSSLANLESMARLVAKKHVEFENTQHRLEQTVKEHCDSFDNIGDVLSRLESKAIEMDQILLGHGRRLAEIARAVARMDGANCAATDPAKCRLCGEPDPSLVAVGDFSLNIDDEVREIVDGMRICGNHVIHAKASELAGKFSTNGS